MASSNILLRGGTILQHDAEDHVHALRNTDILIKGERIEKIGPNIHADTETDVIDCGDKIISPGFVDGHHHLWQTQLKGRHSDDTHLDYMIKGNMRCYSFTPEDVFWGNLGGCLEAIDSGTTCVVDHAHMTYSPEHVDAGLSASITSGLRSIFCYSLMPRFKTWTEEIQPEMPLVPEWFLPLLNELAGKKPLGQGRIWLGFGIDALFLPKEVIVNLYSAARSAGAKVITSHFVKNNYMGSAGPSIPEKLHSYGLLKPDILLSHATGASESDVELLKNAGAYVCSTPDTESQMAHGEIVGFRDDVHGCLGVDCHSNHQGSILHAMRTGLAVARSHRSSRVLSTGKFPHKVFPTTEQAFNLATICGARAIGMSHSLGSLSEGKLADIVIFDTDTPAMICAAEHDPLAAVVRHAGTKEVNTVIVGGIVRKIDGKLTDINVGDSGKWVTKENGAIPQGDSGTISWKQVAEQLMRSRQEVQQRVERSNDEAMRKKFLVQLGVAEDLFL